MIRLLGFSASIKNREEKIVRNYYDLWRFLNDETYEPCRLMILDVRWFHIRNLIRNKLHIIK